MNRIADVLFDPLFLGLALLALSYVHRRRNPRLAFVLPLASLAMLLFFGIPDVANELQRSVELPAITSVKPGVTYDAVIVLGGSMDATIATETGKPAFNEAAERILTGFDVLRTGQAKNGILTGGRPSPEAAESEAQLMKDQLVAWGIDPARLALEEDSANTHENAVGSVKIARDHGWKTVLLVTSAAHMERARGCFFKEGLAVDTLAVDFVAYPSTKSPAGWLPRASALSESTSVIRERVGRLVYRLRGWTD